jgi:hypothetical protein
MLKSWADVIDWYKYCEDEGLLAEEKLDDRSPEERCLDEIFEGQGWSIESIPAF